VVKSLYGEVDSERLTREVWDVLNKSEVLTYTKGSTFLETVPFKLFYQTSKSADNLRTLFEGGFVKRKDGTQMFPRNEADKYTIMLSEAGKVVSGVGAGIGLSFRELNYYPKTLGTMARKRMDNMSENMYRELIGGDPDKFTNYVVENAIQNSRVSTIPVNKIKTMILQDGLKPLLNMEKYYPDYMNMVREGIRGGAEHERGGVKIMANDFAKRMNLNEEQRIQMANDLFWVAAVEGGSTFNVANEIRMEVANILGVGGDVETYDSIK
jgi:hypothetical protein